MISLSLAVREKEADRGAKEDQKRREKKNSPEGPTRDCSFLQKYFRRHKMEPTECDYSTT